MKKQLIKSKLIKSNIALAVACACAAHSAKAQEEADTENTLETIEVIQVTANKRLQTLQSIPASISAMSGDMLEERGISDPRDLETVVPSMITGTGNRGEAILNIRGVGYNEVGSPGVAVHIDSVYQPKAAMGLISQLDIQRVEVLRGPQSTLYGRNANGGVVNYITKAPTDEFEGSVSVGFAEYDQTKVSATFNAPINDDWAARINISSLDRKDGFYENVVFPDNDTGTQDSFGVRLTIAGQITDDVSLKFVATSSDNEGALVGGQLIDTPYNRNLANATIPTIDFGTSIDGPYDIEQDYTSYTAVIDWDLGDWALKSITGYQDFGFYRTSDNDFSDINAVINQTDQDSKTLTQEFNLSGSIGDLDTIFGFFYMDDEAVSGVYFIFPVGFGPFPADPVNPQIVTEAPVYDTNSMALYTDVTWNLSNNLRILGGLRYSEDDQKTVQNNGPACQNVVTELNDSSTLGRFGVQYDYSRHTNMYATYSEGIKTGGINVRSGCQDTFEDEEITSYELGIKSQSNDGRLTTNLTAFFYDYTNLQTEQIVGFNAATNNAPGAEVKGLEIDGTWLPDDHWDLRGSVSLLDATYSEDFINVNTGLPPIFIAPPPGPGEPPVTEAITANVKGNHLNFAPEVSGNISIGYTTDPVLAGGIFKFRLDTTYRSEVTLREFELDGDSNDAVTLVGMSALWLSESEKYSVRAYVDNLTDEAYYTWMGASNQLGFRFTTWNTPRQYGVEFKASF